MNDIAENPLDIAPTPKERRSALLHCGVFLGFGLLMDVVLVVVAKKLLGPSGLDQIPGISVLILVEAIQTLTTVVIPSVIVILLFYASRRSFGLDSAG